MKLWHISIEYEILVATPNDGDENDAEQIAKNALQEEEPTDAYAREITKEQQIPEAWRKALVWGNHQDKEDLTPSMVLERKDD